MDINEAIQKLEVHRVIYQRQKTQSEGTQEALQMGVDALKEKRDHEAEMQTPLYFKRRMELSTLYLQWIKKNNLLDTSLNVITFLESHDLLNRGKCRQFIKESAGVHNGK